MRSGKLDQSSRIGPFILRPATPADVDPVVQDLRKTDLLDIIAATSAPPHAALFRSLETSVARFAVEIDGRCVAITGRQRRDQTGAAGIWLIGTEGFDAALTGGGLRYCRQGFEIIRGGEPCLYNYVPRLNTVDIQWLRWLGFEPTGAVSNFRGRGYTCIRMQWGQVAPSSRQSDGAP